MEKIDNNNIAVEETVDDVKVYDRTMAPKAILHSALTNAGLDIPFMIQEAFLGYKYRKSNHKLYKDDDELPSKLIRLYYTLSPDEVRFDNMKKNFISKYIKQESELESVHCQAEIKGLGEMYVYMHNNDMDELFEESRRTNWFCKNYTDYTLKNLHSKLYTFAPFPDYAGVYRKEDVYLPGTGTELAEWSVIRYKIDEINEDVMRLKEIAKTVKTTEDMLNYLDMCVEIKCKLIKVHPFNDGNGRTIRCFINELLEEVNFPPIYIRANERTAYHNAMNLANNENDYSAIKGFYRYKVCDSIIELDINERVKKEDQETKAKELTLTLEKNKDKPE